jgi:hypothetical protein
MNPALMNQIVSQLDEIERLRGICRNIYEVWDGSEVPPIPARYESEYLYRLIDQMRDEAKEGLK